MVPSHEPASDEGLQFHDACIGEIAGLIGEVQVELLVKGVVFLLCCHCTIGHSFSALLINASFLGGLLSREGSCQNCAIIYLFI